MAWDRTWRCKKKSLTVKELTSAAEAVAEGYKGVQVNVEQEADDCITCFFLVPTEEDTENTFEISIYNLGRDGFVISLEAAAADNRLSDDADQLAEDLADQLEAVPLEL